MHVTAASKALLRGTFRAEPGKLQFDEEEHRVVRNRASWVMVRLRMSLSREPSDISGTGLVSTRAAKLHICIGSVTG